MPSFTFFCLHFHFFFDKLVAIANSECVRDLISTAEHPGVARYRCVCGVSETAASCSQSDVRDVTLCTGADTWERISGVKGKLGSLSTSAIMSLNSRVWRRVPHRIELACKQATASCASTNAQVESLHSVCFKGTCSWHVSCLLFLSHLFLLTF